MTQAIVWKRVREGTGEDEQFMEDRRLGRFVCRNCTLWHCVAHKYDEETPQILKKYDLMGLTVSSEYNGLGADSLTWALALERFGQLGLGVVTFVDVHCLLASLAIEQWDSEYQKKHYLIAAAQGEKILVYGLTEPEAGSEPTSLKTSYEERDGGYVLTGTKYLISNGSIADSLIIFAYPKGRREAGGNVIRVEQEVPNNLPRG